MPLQKLPPNGPLSASTSTCQRPQLQNRRRTLQTISELSATDVDLPDFVSSIGIENIRRLGQNNVPAVRKTTAKNVKRQSLPHYHSTLNVHSPQSSITITPVHGRHLQLPQPSHPMKGRRPITMTSEQVEGWNAKREKARMRQELAITEAKVRRGKSDQRAEITMSTVRPNTESRPKSIRPAFHQQNSLTGSDSGNCLSKQVEQRASLGSTNINTSEYDARPDASERASTDSGSYQSHDSVVNRSRSGSSNTSYTSQDAPPLPHGTNPDMKGYCAELILQNHNLVSFGESARSRNLNPSRSSRTSSLPADVLRHTSPSHHGYVTAPDLRQLPKQQFPQFSAQRAHNQALAALTALNGHSERDRRPQHPTFAYHSPHQNRHASLTSHPPSSSAQRNSASPHRNSLRYHTHIAAQRGTTLPSPVHANDYTNRTSLHRQSDSSHRSSLATRTVPKRESLTQWKQERDEAKANSHYDYKSKMQERVKRANELEEEREKELVSMGKRAAKSESWSCFGGLFAVIKGKRG